MAGKLIVAGVCIGNMLDTPARTILAIRESDYLVTESIDSTRQLFKSLGIEVSIPMIEYLPWFDEPGINKNQHIVDDIINKIKSGSRVVLVSSEGMPLIHDPGYEIVLAIKENDLPITVIPGPSAPIAALNVSGLDAWKFSFESDMPTNADQKELVLKNVKNSDKTSIFFEKDYNLLDTLNKCIVFVSDKRPAALCINLTLPDEMVIRGTIGELLTWAQTHDFIGEYEEQTKIVLLISGKYYKDDHLEYMV